MEPRSPVDLPPELDWLQLINCTIDQMEAVVAANADRAPPDAATLAEWLAFSKGLAAAHLGALESVAALIARASDLDNLIP